MLSTIGNASNNVGKAHFQLQFIAIIILLYIEESVFWIIASYRAIYN